ncbi:tripartite tricarboxylate transporter substrate-binding protein [Pseudorhodoplanes sp.]|uniref:tripartite tricarboxylate transporter substrate-binding protein n=1 Tax=Pseudorhodoplanes sp. TaxID=1934341 RepID=UPI002CF15DE6|nr:tripartite tricarboxylate transporter substrate-binding protein [Pseudorhodoplanes sp.]HWV53200.1 tripartite tricarboxylate transporter substrate-binding protein [Pseudorhodoplanes sp.]
MRLSRRTFLQGSAACALLPASASAQSGTARIYVGFPAGGTLDIIARRIAEKIRSTYTDPVIVEGRIGAGGRIAIEATKTAAPDGLSIVLSPSSPIVIFPHVYRKLSYDPVADLAPVTPVCSNAQAFTVGPGVPDSVRNLAQFVDWARKNKTFYATPAAGSIMHFQGMVFSNKAGLDMTHAPYRGMAPIIPDLLSGTMATSMAVMGDVLPHIADRKLRPLAVTSAQRSRFLPDVPTFAELGYGEVTGIDWYGLFVPAKTPVPVIDKLREATHAAMKDPSFGEALTQMGFDTYALSSTELAARIKSETEYWGPIAKASGFIIDG